MSIIKNSNSTTNTYVTARSFHDITLGTAVDRTGQLWTLLRYIRFMSTSSAPAYYLPLNSPLYSQDTIQILARIPSSANGYFFGAGTMTISKSGNTVTWTSGSNTATVTVTDWDNFHIFGFVEGKPMLDLNVLASWTVTDGLVASAGAWYGACSGQTDNITQIDIQRINIYGKSSTSASAQRMQKAYYPMIRLDSISSLGFFEARRRRTGVNATGLEDTTNFHTSSSSYAYSVKDEQPDTVTYGVQLDDLHVMFGNGYHELIPTVCADGGIDEGRGWDGESASDPFVVSGKSFAFNLKGIPLAGTPISGTGVTGELMTGRKPMWSIWNDMIKFGFHVENRNGTDYILFNVCKDYKGEWHKPAYDTSNVPKIPLELFDGYDNDGKKIHAPSLSLPQGMDNMTVEYHNGFPVICTIDMEHCLVGPTREFSSDTTYKKMVFKMNSGVAAMVKAAIGNLAPWNYTRTQLGESNYSVYGMAVTIMNNNDQFPLLDVMETESQSLSSESSDAVKLKYRTEHEVGDASLQEDAKLWLFNELKNGATLTLPAILRLVKTLASGIQPATFIDTSNLLNPKECKITGAIDPHPSKTSDSHWRTIIDDQIRREYTTHVPVGDVTRTMNWTDVHIGIMGTVLDNVSNDIYTKTVFGSNVSDTTNKYIAIPFLPCKKQDERESTVGMNILAIRDTNITSTGGRTNEFIFVAVFEAYTYDTTNKEIVAYKFCSRKCVKIPEIEQTIRSIILPGVSIIKFDQADNKTDKHSDFSRRAFDWDGMNSTWQWGAGDTYKRLDYYVNFAFVEAAMLNRSNGQPTETPDEQTLDDNTTLVAHIYSADGSDTAHFISGLVNKGNNSIANSRWLPISQAIVQFYSSSGVVGNAFFFPKPSQIIEQRTLADQVIFSDFFCKYQYSNNAWSKVNDNTWPNPTLKVYKMGADDTTPTLVATISTWSASGSQYVGQAGNISVSVSVNQTYEGRYRDPNGNYHKNDNYFFLVTIIDSTTNENRNGYTYYIDFAAS